MKKIVLLSFFFTLILATAHSQELKLSTNWPDSIYSGKQGKMHVQSVAVDEKNGYVYFSFTDKLVKMDL